MLTYKVKLNLSESDKNRLLAVLEAERWAFNYCSNKHFCKDSPRKNSIVELHAACYKAIRKERPDIPSQVVIRAEQACLAAYRSVKSGKYRLKSPIEKRALSIRVDKRLASLNGTTIKITAIEGKRDRIKGFFTPYPKLADIMTRYPVCDPAIFEQDGQMWLSLTFKNPEPATMNGLALGVDLGVNRIVATSEGQIIKDVKFNEEKRKLRHLKRKLSSASDRGSDSARRHLLKIKRRELRKSRNQTHIIVNQLLANPATTYVLEDLSGLKKNTSAKNIKTKGPKQAARINNKVSQTPFCLIKRILTYKAQALGKRVVTVNPFETSQRDNRTGKKDGERRGSRYYASDGVVFDADCNAAINIAKRSKLPFSRGNVLDGQVNVVKPNVRFSSHKPTTLVIGGRHSDMIMHPSIERKELINGGQL